MFEIYKEIEYYYFNYYNFTKKYYYFFHQFLTFFKEKSTILRILTTTKWWSKFSAISNDNDLLKEYSKLEKSWESICSIETLFVDKKW